MALTDNSDPVSGAYVLFRIGAGSIIQVLFWCPLLFSGGGVQCGFSRNIGAYQTVIVSPCSGSAYIGSADDTNTAFTVDAKHCFRRCSGPKAVLNSPRKLKGCAGLQATHPGVAYPSITYLFGTHMLRYEFENFTEIKTSEQHRFCGFPKMHCL